MKQTDRFSHFSKSYALLILFVLSYGYPGQAEAGTNDQMVYGRGRYIYGAQIDGWGEQTKQRQRENAAEFLEMLSEAVEHGAHEIELDKGHYRFSASHLEGSGRVFISIRDVDDLTIHGNGAQFWFEDYMTAIRIENCRNISFHDLTIDWDPLPFSQAVITAIDPEGKYIEGKTESGFRNMNAILSDPSVQGTPTVKVFFFDPQTGVLKDDVAHSEISSIESIGEDRLRYYGRVYGVHDYKSINIEPGDRMAFVMRHDHAVRIYGSQDITFDNLRLYSSPMFGIAMGNGGGNMVLKNSKLVPRPGTKRLMSINGDALHFTSLQKGPRIEGCEFSGAGDDIMNIHGDFAMVQQQRSANTLIIAIKNHINIFEGSTIRIYDFDRMQLRGEYEVQSVARAGGKWKGDAKAVGQEKNVKFWPGRESLVCELDRPIEASRYDIVESDFDGGYGTVVRDNFLHNLTTRGFLIQTKHAVVEGNRFVHVDNAAIAIMASLKWCEGPIPENIIFRSNTIIRPGWTYGSRHSGNSKIGAVSVNLEYYGSLKQDNRPIRNIIIEKNRIENAGTSGVFMIHSKSSIIQDNAISGFCRVDPWRVGMEYGIKPYAAIYVDDSEELEIVGNDISDPGGKARGDILVGEYAEEGSIRIRD